MKATKKRNGVFMFEAENEKENQAVLVLIEMVNDLCEAGLIADETFNQHGHIMRGSFAANCVAIPGVEYIHTAKAMPF